MEESVVYFSLDRRSKERRDDSMNGELKVGKDLKKKVFMQNLYTLCNDSFFLEKTKGEYALSYLDKINQRIKTFDKTAKDYDEISEMIESIGEKTIRRVMRSSLDQQAKKTLSADKEIYRKFLKELEGHDSSID